MNWMGISSQTDWNYLSRPESTDALKCLEAVCKEFLDAAPMLLNDLSHNLEEPAVRMARSCYRQGPPKEWVYDRGTGFS
jgi:hypothetical protein